MTDASPDSQTIRVMVVDDHTVVRSGLSALLYAFDDFELVGEAADGEEAIRVCARVQPDVILMDLIMPRMDGPTATRAIREKYPKVQILVLTSFKEDNLVHDALRAGAIGYLLKNVTPDELANAIRAARRARGRPLGIVAKTGAPRLLANPQARRPGGAHDPGPRSRRSSHPRSNA